MRDIVLPKLNNTDSAAVVNRWLMGEGAKTASGEPLVEVETSKAVNELEAPVSGILHHVVESGAEAAFGSRIGVLFESIEEYRNFLAHQQSAPAGTLSSTELVMTKAAQELIDKYAIDSEAVRSLGKKVIKASDLTALLAPANETVMNLPKSQQGVGRVVAESHRTIPAAFTVLRVGLDAFDEVQGRDAGSGLGLAEFAVKAMAAQHADHPLFFSSPADGARVILAPAPNVGVTVDVGTGLSIPVIKDAHSRTGQEVADLLMELRLQALDGTLRGEDLAGGNITLSLNDDQDVVFAQPIVFPGQVCMLSIGGRQAPLPRVQAGPVDRDLFYLGVAYDHRIVNGRDAVMFGRAVKALLEDREWLDTVQAS
ncbi:2-oxo acid dehydrogenase subunit E2 [Actinacidiphila glaucinigra]|uniref:Dihydrolipoamide acetyltransferase component of pyruvate dehydrogenase complex n=1 Tax=Actinacidiphila glaucinigra TaxID=235986 RepID=A0A239NPC9_9ACTN|nr:2-oxo acid dehydrogenase subunit E2 [Actinacidiphila glaucinigra]SNT56224.1 2-oxoglutarate dehydrogenase E2 component (dihydrolipoamide succinyltransferase) [Actinacidiphila glaucinigra]